MSISARVRSIPVLEEWKGALKRFAGDTQQILQAANLEIQRTEDWLRERANHWHHKVEESRDEVERAKRDLEDCREDSENDCSEEEDTLIESKHRLRKAEEELENVRRWTQQVGEVVAIYRAQAYRLNGFINKDLSQANAFLGRIISELQAYVQVQQPIVPAGVSGEAYAQTGIASKLASTPWNTIGDPEDKQKLQNALSRLEESEKGKAIAEAISKSSTEVCFGQTKKGALAQYISNKITLDESVWKDASPNRVAAIIAHEGTHLQWEIQRNGPRAATREEYIDEEYHAFKAQFEVWLEVGGVEIDPELDQNLAMFRSMSEVDIKSRIREQYKEELDELFP